MLTLGKWRVATLKCLQFDIKGKSQVKCRGEIFHRHRICIQVYKFMFKQVLTAQINSEHCIFLRKFFAKEMIVILETEKEI